MIGMEAGRCADCAAQGGGGLCGEIIWPPDSRGRPLLHPAFKSRASTISRVYLQRCSSDVLLASISLMFMRCVSSVTTNLALF